MDSYSPPMIWPYIFLSYASLFVFGLSDNVRGPLFPEILSHFEVNDSMGSLMWALSNISGLLAGLMAQYLLRRFDRLQVLRGSILGLLISLLGLAASPQFTIFLFFSFLMGLSLGLLGMIPNILVPLGTPTEKKQRMLSGLHMMYGLASLLAPLLAAGVQISFQSWRGTFASAALAPLLLLVYSFHSSHQSLHSKINTPEKPLGFGKSKNFKPQIFLAFMLSLAVSVEIMVSSRLALYMQRIWEFPMEKSSLYVTYFFISLMLGRFLFAVVHFRKTPQYLLSLSLIFTLGLFLLGLFWHPLCLALTGFSIAPFFPLTIMWVSQEFPDDLDAGISYLMIIDSIMLISMHLFVGKLTDLFDIRKAFYSAPVLILIALMMVLSFNLLFKKKSQTQ